MASVEVAAKANHALVLPNLVVLEHLSQSKVLSSVSKTFQDADKLPGGEAIVLKLEDGKTLKDGEILEYLLKLDDRNPDINVQQTEWIQRSSVRSIHLKNDSFSCPRHLYDID